MLCLSTDYNDNGDTIIKNWPSFTSWLVFSSSLVLFFHYSFSFQLSCSLLLPLPLSSLFLMPACTMVSSSLLLSWFFLNSSPEPQPCICAVPLSSFSFFPQISPSNNKPATGFSLLAVFLVVSHTFPLQLFSPHCFLAGFHFLSSYFHLISTILFFSYVPQILLSLTSIIITCLLLLPASFRSLCSSRSTILPTSNVLPVPSSISSSSLFLSKSPFPPLCFLYTWHQSVQVLLQRQCCTAFTATLANYTRGRERAWLSMKRARVTLHPKTQHVVKGPLFERFLQVLTQHRETGFPKLPLCAQPFGSFQWSV